MPFRRIHAVVDDADRDARSVPPSAREKCRVSRGGNGRAAVISGGDLIRTFVLRRHRIPRLDARNLALRGEVRDTVRVELDDERAEVEALDVIRIVDMSAELLDQSVCSSRILRAKHGDAVALPVGLLLDD